MNDYPYSNMQELTLAMATIPVQEFRDLFENLEEAFQTGTLFRSLDKPLTGRRCV